MCHCHFSFSKLDVIGFDAACCLLAGQFCYRTDWKSQGKFLQLVGVNQISVVQKVAFACIRLLVSGLDFGHAVLAQGCLHHGFQPLLPFQGTNGTTIEAKYVARKHQRYASVNGHWGYARLTGGSDLVLLCQTFCFGIDISSASGSTSDPNSNAWSLSLW